MIFLGILLAVVAILYFWYAGIIRKRNRVNEALGGIDVQLTMRSDLIPNILTIAKKFMEHEKSLLETITQLRTQASAPYDKGDATAIANHLSAAEALSSQMGQLKIAVEAYPTLKSDQTMIQAMQSYNEVEAQLAAARRFYNAAVTALNNAVQIFPGNLIAGYAGVSAMPFYEAAEAARAPVNAKDFL